MTGCLKGQVERIVLRQPQIQRRALYAPGDRGPAHPLATGIAHTREALRPCTAFRFRSNGSHGETQVRFGERVREARLLAPYPVRNLPARGAREPDRNNGRATCPARQLGYRPARGTAALLCMRQGWGASDAVRAAWLKVGTLAFWWGRCAAYPKNTDGIGICRISVADGISA